MEKMNYYLQIYNATEDGREPVEQVYIYRSTILHRFVENQQSRYISTDLQCDRRWQRTSRTSIYLQIYNATEEGRETVEQIYICRSTMLQNMVENQQNRYISTDLQYYRRGQRTSRAGIYLQIYNSTEDGREPVEQVYIYRSTILQRMVGNQQSRYISADLQCNR